MSQTVFKTVDWDRFTDKFIEMGVLLINEHNEDFARYMLPSTHGRDVERFARGLAVQDKFLECSQLINRMAGFYDIVSREELRANFSAFANMEVRPPQRSSDDIGSDDSSHRHSVLGALFPRDQEEAQVAASSATGSSSSHQPMTHPRRPVIGLDGLRRIMGALRQENRLDSGPGARDISPIRSPKGRWRSPSPLRTKSEESQGLRQRREQKRRKRRSNGQDID